MTAATRTRLETAHEAYGAALPAWVRELAMLIDKVGLKRASRIVGYSNAVLHEVVRGTYKGSVEKVCERVSGAILQETVDCPVLGELRRDTCLDWQAKPYAITSSHRMRMYRACRSGCPHSRLADQGDVRRPADDD